MLNTSRSKGIQAMEFGKLIEYSMRKTSLEKSYTKSGGETVFCFVFCFETEKCLVFYTVCFKQFYPS